MRIQQLPLPGREGHEAILCASYLDDIAEALSRWHAQRVLLVVSTSLDTKTDIIRDIETRLGQDGDYRLSKKTGVGSHSPYHDVIDIAHRVQSDSVEAVVSIGSGSYSDACKAALMLAATLPLGFGPIEMEALVDPVTGLAGHDRLRPPTTKLICVPTSLSAGEWNMSASATNPQGKKQHFAHPQGAPTLILLDPRVAATTPSHLWLASGMRAVDHFVEGMCYPGCPAEAREVSSSGLRQMLRGLHEYCTGRQTMDEKELLRGISDCQRGSREALLPYMKWGVRFGASHAMGHQLGSLAGVQHGITSCILLPHVLRYTIDQTQTAQTQVLSIFNEALGWEETQAGDAVARFVALLGLPSTLTQVGVTDDQQIQKIAENTLSDVLAGKKNLPDVAGLKRILEMAK
ncbi:hypothetical protein FE257_009137 [Aspergillus nanangensis]|uniref:Alcohol dehydrogenase iron-type/glycerol dehydrogenase GldA domain-containing protein n=1 Tax=Aspergillus nanangensis TaxID=2582783 RepID=A0AAD4GXT4_ASPNN|nr:hypothetical protein FE257_009137 [Aspergillus nanangensis]